MNLLAFPPCEFADGPREHALVLLLLARSE